VTLTWAGPDGVLGTADDQVLTTTTDANGNYAFTGIPGRVYRVDVDQTTAPAGLR
jgi:large repetitive protein